MLRLDNFSKFRIIVFLFIIINATFASREISKISVAYEQVGTIDIKTGRMTEIFLNITVPQSFDKFQSSALLQQNQEFRTVEDFHKNKLMTLNLKNPAQPFVYKTMHEVNTSEIKLSKINDIDNSNERYSDSYTKSLIKTDQKTEYDKEILDLALAVTENASNDFEKITFLAKFVNEFISYDLSHTGKEYSAKEIMKLRKGVCTEYTTLFVSMARALGFPSRYVIGLTYDETTKDFQPHAWAEVMINNTWIQVDPTWLEVGRISAGRIITQKSENLKTLNNVYVYANAKSNFDVKWDYEKKVSLLYLEYAQNYNKNLKLKTYVTELYRDSLGLVVAEVKEDHFSIENLSFVSCVDSNNFNVPVIHVVDSLYFNVLYPNKSAYFWFVVKINPNLNLQKYYEIVCPVQIYSLYHGKLDFVIKINPYEIGKKSKLSASLKKKTVESFNDFNRLSLKYVERPAYLVSRYRFDKFSSDTETNVFSENYGTNYVVVSDNVKTVVFSYNTSKNLSAKHDTDGIKLIKLEIEPNKLDKNELSNKNITACAHISNSRKKMYEITFSINNQIVEKKVEVKEVSCIEIDKKTIKPGENIIKATINDSDTTSVLIVDEIDEAQQNTKNSFESNEIKNHSLKDETGNKNNQEEFNQSSEIPFMPIIVAIGTLIFVLLAIFKLAEFREKHGI
ncbi:MAG: transglutaminase-like domain-containing protein [Candidatus Micrarchaeota archaeon]|nr:transglutaminase-like domain-containing protein [Candidatus Micrarchaeota archaeon]